MDATFPHLYECDRLTESPSTGIPHYYYPGASRQGGHDGLLLELRPEAGEPWLGTFAFGDVTPKGVSGVFTTPDPDQVCVVSRGEGYLVSVSTPTNWKAVLAAPIIDVRSIPARGIIVFADYTTIAAYGQGGLYWKTLRLSWDGLRITEVTDSSIKGEFFDPSGSMETFVVDLATGSHEGDIWEGH